MTSAIPPGGGGAGPGEPSREERLARVRAALGPAPDNVTPLPTTGVSAEDAEIAAMSAAAEFARRVELAAFDLRVREAARVKVLAERTPAMPPFDAGLLEEILAREPEPPHRIEALVPWEASTLFVAQRKTGKTTLLLNLARSLLTGGHFLGQFPVRPLDGRVGFLNFEVAAAQLARWAHEHGVPEDRMYQVNLRGRRNPFATDEDREELAERLRMQEVESLIVDPFGQAFVGKSQQDNTDVGAWLGGLDRFARSDAGALDVMLAVHAGWEGERSRGASALEDWADSIIYLTRAKNDDGSVKGSPRFFRAIGRDVEVDEDQLAFEPSTRALTLTGDGSRQAVNKSRGIEELIPEIVRVVNANPGIAAAELVRVLRSTSEVGFQDRDVTQAARRANALELIVRKELGKGRQVLHYPIEKTDNTGLTSTSDVVGNGQSGGEPGEEGLFGGTN